MKITGSGLLWSASKGQIVADLRAGPIETDDPHVIELARRSGFMVEGEAPVEHPELITIEIEPVTIDNPSPSDKPRRGRPAKVN